MRIEHLIHVKSIAENDSISKAATALYISPQALSASIRQLEKELNITIFSRNRHGALLTPDGQYILDAAEQVLPVIEDLKNHFNKQQPLTPTKITVASDFYFKEVYLPIPISKYIKQHPGHELKIVVQSNEAIASSLVSQEVELGFLDIIYLDKVPQYQIPDDLLYIPLLEYRYGAYISIHSPLATHDTLSIESLLQYPIVFSQDQFLENDPNSCAIYRALSQFGEIKHIAADSSLQYCQFISNDLGVSIIRFSDPLATDTTRKPLRNKLTGVFGCAIHRDRQDDPILNQLLQMVKDNLNNAYAAFR